MTIHLFGSLVGSNGGGCGLVARYAGIDIFAEFHLTRVLSVLLLDYTDTAGTNSLQPLLGKPFPSNSSS
jgi:hypothetical protein